MPAMIAPSSIELAAVPMPGQKLGVLRRTFGGRLELSSRLRGVAHYRIVQVRIHQLQANISVDLRRDRVSQSFVTATGGRSCRGLEALAFGQWGKASGGGQSKGSYSATWPAAAGRPQRKFTIYAIADETECEIVIGRE